MRSCRNLLSLFLSLSLFVVALAQPFSTPHSASAAQESKARVAVTAPAGDLSLQLAAIEKTIEQSRKDLGIPGLSLAIVKDDKVIYLKGLGFKDFEHSLPVTPDTLFAIGSSTKAFTAMTAMMSVDEGKLSLSDSPKKYLPYFQMRDPDTDAKITIRDLLSHRSGLNRTDLAMVTNKLTREELIKVAGMAKPTAKLGAKFQYQNVMYTAAGEIVARSQHSTWDAVIARKIFKPLGMKSSNTTVQAMQKSRNFSFGYDFNTTTKETRRLPQREISIAAPAGAINSSARDMAEWVRFMLNRGTVNGRRLVSEKSFDELITKQINISGNVDYGLGWFLRQWNGHKVVEHGGNIDGFNAQVAFMPDEKLGFVLLTNVTGSSLGATAMNTVWLNIVGKPQSSDETVSGPAVDPKTESGTYKLASAGVNFDVAFKEGKLVLTVPGQPSYPLENLNGRRYKLAAPAPDGFFATFRSVKGKEGETELFLEQPQGNIVLQKLKETSDSAAPVTDTTEGSITTDELIARIIAAAGGEENLRKHKSAMTTVEIDLENQGVQGAGVVTAKAPNMSATNITLTALGKKIGSVVTYFDGTRGGQIASFAPEEVLSGKRLQDVKLDSDFYGLLNWQKNFKTITIKRVSKVGDEDAYVVEKVPEKGNRVTDYISVKTFLLLRRDTILSSDTTNVELPQTEIYSDYRNVDGVMIPFKSVSNTVAYGDIVTRVKDVKFDVELPDSDFLKPVKSGPQQPE